MYAKRIQIINYGPIEKLDIEFPFDEAGNPKPVLLVGENGSGKSILLSHIVNGLISFKDAAYKETPEVDAEKVYKIRSGTYIKQGKEFYFSRVDFDHDLHIEEMTLARRKQEGEALPMDNYEDDVKNAWNKINDNDWSHFDWAHLSYNFDETIRLIKDIFSKNCALYFPFNRFEEPAWLNEKHLNVRAELTKPDRIEGYTNRKIINYSSLRDSHNWLFDVVYDAHALKDPRASNAYNLTISILRHVMKAPNIRFGIGTRFNRRVTVMKDIIGGISMDMVANIFQLSSGETSLLNLFLSILRDFDFSRADIENAESVRGIAVVDEIDLHLHANHQCEILPELICMFPRVQFIVTTHSPLFALGMREEKYFGKNGFDLYRLPDGQKIESPEEFSEFEAVYKAITNTSKFQKDIQNAQQPLVYMEGATDVKYLERAAELMEKKPLLSRIKLDDADGEGNLKAIWNKAKELPDEVVPQKVGLFFDCEVDRKPDKSGNIFLRIIPKKDDHPIEKGIENLFEKATLEKARSHKRAFIDIVESHKKTIRGENQEIPEKWEVNEDEKRHLCDWLCKYGEKEDFEHFAEVFALLEEILESDDETAQTGE